MAAELVRGQNLLLPALQLTIRLTAEHPVIVGVTLSDGNNGPARPGWVAHPGSPVLLGLEVPRSAATEQRLDIDLEALPEQVVRAGVLLALPGGADSPQRFGVLRAPHVVVGDLDGADIARYAVTGLDSESALVVLEFYRRHGAWKARAVGQGYAGGLVELLADQGHTGAHRLAADIDAAVARHPRDSAAPPVSGRLDRERSRQPERGPEPAAAATWDAEDGAPPSPAHGQAAVAHPDRASTHGRRGAGGAQASAASSQQLACPDGTGPTGESSDSSRSSASFDGGRIDYRHPRRQNAAPPRPPTASPAPPEQPAQPVAGDAVGWSMDERLYNQVWGMFEDLARSTAAYRSAVDFADSRLEKELDQVLADPRSRMGTAGDAAREAAHARHTQLAGQARAALDRDLAQLTAESEVVEPALPPAYARWDNPVWHGYRVPTEPPTAVRLGDLHLPESAPLRIPMLVRLPLERGLWIDSGPVAGPDDSFLDSAEARRLAMDAALALAVRLLAVHPAGEFAVQLVDPAGAAAQALLPLTRSAAVAAPRASGAAGVADILGRLTRRVDLTQMAVRGGAAESLPPDIDTARQLLIVNDFPHGFDDRAVTQLRYIADEGPAVGVHLLMVADREEAEAYGPLLDPLWRSLMRLTPVPDDHLADPWVGHAWTYEPSLVPSGSQVLQQVLTEVTAASTKRG
ncbi:TerD family protein [Streptomyces sp. NPDC005728]|uniref:TerD family protein n=1 Tax=Streptomyces sp. NPDC005728 TaxID=3157054 RepID=UPI0033C76DFB